MNVPDTGETEKLLGPLPTGRAEEPERFPGGADALDDQEKYGEIPEQPLTPDVPPADNPAATDAPEAITEEDDKPQAEDGGADQEAGTSDPEQAAIDGQPGENLGEPDA